VVALDEPVIKVAPPAPEPVPEQARTCSPAAEVGAAPTGSPPPELQHNEPEAGGGEQVETVEAAPAEATGK
jgi:hypothetical protein